MKNYLRIALIALFGLIYAPPIRAQFENVSDDDRLGGKGTKRYDQNAKYYTDFNRFRDRFSKVLVEADGSVRKNEKGEPVHNGKFDTDPTTWPCDSMYECWRRLYDGAPFYTKNIYIQGATMLDSMALHAPKSEAERLMYFQDLMQVYEDRIRRNDSLNSIEKEERYKSTRPAVMVKAATVYQHTAPKVKGSGYTALKAYQNYVKAFAAIREATNAANDEMHPSYLVNYFMACRDLYLSDKDKYTEQFLTDYTTCLESCDKMMADYAGNEAMKETWQGYANARNDIGVYYLWSGAGSAANLEKFYSPRLDSIKNNYTALKNAVHLMMTNDTLLSSPVFYKACNYSFKLQPDYENCIGKAQQEKNEFENREGALEYFHQAEELSSTPHEHFVTSAYIAAALMSEPKPSPATLPGEWEALSTNERNERIRSWWARQNVAARKMEEAIDWGVQAGVNGQNLAPLYMSVAQSYRKAEDAATIDLASQALDQIPAIYPAYSQARIEQERTNIRKVRETLAKKAAAEAAYKKNKAQYEKWQRQQAAIAAKRKAEEDFWKR